MMGVDCVMIIFSIFPGGMIGRIFDHRAVLTTGWRFVEMTQLTHYDVKGRVTLSGPRITFTCRAIIEGLILMSGEHTITIQFGDDPDNLTGLYMNGTTSVRLVGHRRLEEDDWHVVRMDAEEEGWEHLWIEVSWNTSAQLGVALMDIV